MTAPLPKFHAALAFGLLAAALTGCSTTSQSFPLDRDMVWRAAVGEAVVWRPTLINDETYLIESVKTNLTGAEQRYKLTVDRDPNPFARRPSTRVYVRMGQTRPNRVRFKRLEKEFLMRLKAKLSELTPARSP